MGVSEIENSRLKGFSFNALSRKMGSSIKLMLAKEKMIVNNNFCNNRKLFNNKSFSTGTTLSEYVWEKKEKFNIIPSMEEYIVRSESTK